MRLGVGRVTAAPGSLVRFYYDASGTVGVGDVIETARTRRRYGVLETRQQTRGKHAGRWHLRCVVLEPDEQLVEGSRVWQLYWYPRGRR